MNHRVLERVDLLASIFSDFFKNCMSMPKRKYCEHPTKHANATRVLKGVVSVSLHLSVFLISRYDAADDRIRWLCPRCHAFEWKEMMTRQLMELSDNESPLENEAMAEDSIVRGDKNDDAINVEFNDLNEEEEQNPPVDSAIIAESKDDGDNLSCMDDETADHESIDEEIGYVSYELQYQKDKVMEQLSTIFKLLNIDPIHDKYVHTCFLNFLERLLCLDRQYHLFELKLMKYAANFIDYVIYWMKNLKFHMIQILMDSEYLN